ncbi:MAG: mercuric transporter MerT family protein [candidate division WOR-3 bacterium]
MGETKNKCVNEVGSFNTGNNKKGIIASILAMVGIGMCCSLPLISALLGISSTYLSFLAPIRKIPHFDVILSIASLSLLGYAHFLNFKDKKNKKGECCKEASKTKTVILWLATIFVISFITYDYVILPLSLKAEKTEIQAVGTKYKEYRVYIDGMDCPACFQAIKQSIQKKVGKADYDLVPDFKNQILTIKIAEDEKTEISQFVSAIEDVGYKVKIINHSR